MLPGTDFGATQLAVLTGTSADGFYEPVVWGGDGYCDKIKAAWVEITQAEAARIANGSYPCEYKAAYNYWPISVRVAGHALMVGCWPRVLQVDTPLDDPEAEARRMRAQEGTYLLPPNHPVLVEALYGCYREALEGPPGGWTPTGERGWPRIPYCHAALQSFGNPVRYFGVQPECAAEMFTAKVEELRTTGVPGKDLPRWGEDGTVIAYDGDYSWSNCPTLLSQIPGALEGSFAQRCNAVIDASADAARTAAIADGYGLTVAEFLTQVRAMFCPGSRDNLSNYPQFGGDLVARWLPPQGAVCFETALLLAVANAFNSQLTQVKFC